jgi:hypothetical protein
VVIFSVPLSVSSSPEAASFIQSQISPGSKAAPQYLQVLNIRFLLFLFAAHPDRKISLAKFAGIVEFEMFANRRSAADVRYIHHFLTGKHIVIRESVVQDL